MRFADRVDAGRQIARHLTHYANRDDVIVLALRRGIVPVAFEIARSLGVPFDVFAVRKLGVPDDDVIRTCAAAWRRLDAHPQVG